jgi:hypothetical protein
MQLYCEVRLRWQEVTYHFTKKDYVFSSDEKQAMPVLSYGIRMINTLNGVFQDQVGCM